MSARDWALFELDGRRLPGWSPRLLRGRPPKLDDPRDLSLGEQIFIGVVKNLLRLRHLLEHHSGRSAKSVDPLVQKVMAVALYQLTSLDRVPASAAVNEAVEQAKRFGRAKSAGFVNAVLRKVGREPPPAQPSDPAAIAQFVYSHPRELFERFVKLVGVDDALKLCAHDNAEPPAIVRLIPPATVDQLYAEGVTARPHEMAGLYVVASARKHSLADWAQRGLAQVQDPTAAGVVPVMECRPGERVLDRCAGLGTKTLQLQAAVGSAGSVVAMDPNEERCRGLRELAMARAASNIEIFAAGMMADVPALRDAQFDRILVDAPCSNSGVLARRPEARYAQASSALASLEALQDRILDDVAPHVAPDGLLAYSTCSIWPEENERQVARFLARHGDFMLAAQQGTLPSLDPEPMRYHDGGFFSLLRRHKIDS